MFGRNEIVRLELQKQALVLESGLRRLELQEEVQNFRSALAGIGRLGKKGAPFLMLLAPVAGFLLARGVRQQPMTWLGRLTKLTKFIGPAYALWRSFSARRGGGESEETS